MANTSKIRSSVIKFLEAMKACDELPEGLEDEALKMSEGVAEGMQEDECAKDEDVVEEEEKNVEDEGEEEEKLEAKIEDTMTKVLRKYGLIKDSAMKSLDEVEEELDVVDANGEEEVTVDPEKINDSMSRKAFLREVKPIIASIPSSATRAKLSDSIAKLLRNSKTSDDQYSMIYKTSNKAAKNGARISDSKVDDQMSLGMDIAAKFNPHYKKED